MGKAETCECMPLGDIQPMVQTAVGVPFNT